MDYPDDGRSVGQEQARIAAEFWKASQEIGIERWFRGDGFSQGGRRILVGIAPSYSANDVALAMRIASQKPRWSEAVVVQFFDILDVENMTDLQLYIPGIGDVQHTPVVGIWDNGILVKSAQGHLGRQTLEQLLGPF